jgi:two-component system LytT family response regulator
MPPTIFVTAYDQYAIQAFSVAAVDYLVKPFDDERFEQALARARRLVELEGMDRLRQQLITLLQGGSSRRPPPNGCIWSG